MRAVHHLFMEVPVLMQDVMFRIRYYQDIWMCVCGFCKLVICGILDVLIPNLLIYADDDGLKHQSDGMECQGGGRGAGCREALLLHCFSCLFFS